MKDAIGGGLLFNLVIIFVVAIVVLFISSLAYSKAYKVKNRIIELVEKYEGYSTEAIAEIKQDLQLIGYSAEIPTKCSNVEPNVNLNDTGYKYCIYERSTSNENKYYEVVTYVHFEFPFIEDFIDLPVKGETKMLGNNYKILA